MRNVQGTYKILAFKVDCPRYGQFVNSNLMFIQSFFIISIKFRSYVGNLSICVFSALQMYP